MLEKKLNTIFDKSKKIAALSIDIGNLSASLKSNEIQKRMKFNDNEVKEYARQKVSKYVLHEKNIRNQRKYVFSENDDLNTDFFAIKVGLIFNDFLIKDPDSKLLVGVEVDLSTYYPADIECLCDVVIFSNDAIHIIDFDNDKTEEHNALNNPNVLVKAYGIKDLYGSAYKTDNYLYTLYQPSFDNIDTWSFDINNIENNYTSED